MSVQWGWDDLWSFFVLESDDHKSLILKQINEGNWIGRLTPDYQAQVFKSAPHDIKSNLHKLPMIHRETLELLNLVKKEKRRRRL